MFFQEVTFDSFDQAENLDLLSGAVAALTAHYSKSCNQVGDFVIHYIKSVMMHSI